MGGLGMDQVIKDIREGRRGDGSGHQSRDTREGGRTGCVWEWIILRNKGVWDWEHVMSCWSCVHF